VTTEVVRMPSIALDTGSVSTMLGGAVECGAAKLGKSGREVVKALHLGDCPVCEAVRYQLAIRLAEYLGSVDSTVKAVYWYEPDYAIGVEEPIPDRPNLSPGINMIVWANRKSAALTSVVASLNSALSEEVRRFGCPKANALCWALEVQVVDDDQVRRRTGYGALIDSIYVRPVGLWYR
jgi:hypothetical protein